MSTRVDLLLVARGLAPSRARARSLIEAGAVRVNGAQVHKPSHPCEEGCEVTLEGTDHAFVSRGGLKLAGALDDFGLDPAELVVADLGASTGGFTDCLLQRGAARVYAIDVGHDQLHAKLRRDARVVCMEGVNARHLAAGDLPEPVDLVVVDASFISLAKLLPSAHALLRAGGQLLGLVKPQFEVGADRVGRGGVVREDALRQAARDAVEVQARALGFATRGSRDSRVHGPRGNREIFLWLDRP